MSSWVTRNEPGNGSGAVRRQRVAEGGRPVGRNSTVSSKRATRNWVRSGSRLAVLTRKRPISVGWFPGIPCYSFIQQERRNARHSYRYEM